MLKTKISGVLKVVIAALVLVPLCTAGIVIYLSRKPKIGGEFRLEHREKHWLFSEHARPLNLIYFGYAKCPDVCPLSLSFTAQAFEALTEEQRKDVNLIFVSVDVAHDTPDSVADYASQFFPQFIGLTGTEVEIRKVVDLFGASYMVEEDPKSYLGYSIAHTDRLFFLNKKGHVIDLIANPRVSEEIVNKIKEHL